MDFGEQLTLWTIRLSLICYSVTLGVRLADRDGSWDRVARLWWTVGCGLAIVHVTSAFHFHHHWSHGHAVAETAVRTEQVVGWRFGGGVYFNYAFVAIWAGDVSWWWFSPGGRRERGGLVGLLVQGYLLFIAINGAIVFEQGPTRYCGVGVLLLLAALWIRRRRSTSDMRSDDSAP